MGLKQLLIILLLFGTGNSLYSLIGAGLIMVFTLLNIVFRRFWSEETNVILGIIFTGFLSSLVLFLGQTISYKWSMDNKLFLYSLPIIPIVLLEFKEVKFKILVKELMVYIDAFVFIGVIKELLVSGSLFGLKILKGYEGLLIFNNNSGTLLLVGITMIITEMLKKREEK